MGKAKTKKAPRKKVRHWEKRLSKFTRKIVKDCFGTFPDCGTPSLEPQGDCASCPYKDIMVAHYKKVHKIKDKVVEVEENNESSNIELHQEESQTNVQGQGPV